LYEKSMRSSRPKRDKSPVDIEYEKSVNECTFRPNLDKNTNKQK
jgi:hypothetical protein